MNVLRTCSICGHKVEQEHGINYSDKDKIVPIKCPLCKDYNFEIQLRNNPEFQSQIQGKGYILSGILRNRAERNQTTELKSDNFKDIFRSMRIPRSVIEKMEWLLKYLGEKPDPITEWIKLNPATDYPIIFGKNESELNFLIVNLMERKLIERNGADRYRLSIDGWQRLEEIKRRIPDSNKAFVAMWFDDSLDAVWKNGFYAGLKECGYDPIRIDFVEHNNKICDEIIATIRESSLVVADFTGNRGGVYFEAGFAMGLGIPVIWTCREDEIDKLHFDTRQYNHIVWKDAEDLKIKLINRITATGLKKRGFPKNC